VSRKKAQPFKIRNILPYAYHEAGHAVVGHVIGRLIERVSIASSPQNGYRGYCRFSPYIESANGHLEWQEDSANPDIVTIYFAGRVATEMVCTRHGWDYEMWQECERADREAIERWCRESLEPEGTGLVGARCHHASALGRTADHHRLAAQLRMIALLDGGVIGVQVDMQDNTLLSLSLFHAFFHCSRWPLLPHRIRETGQEAILTDGQEAGCGRHSRTEYWSALPSC